MFSLNGYSYMVGGQSQVEKYNDATNAWNRNPLLELLSKLGVKSAKPINVWTTKTNLSAPSPGYMLPGFGYSAGGQEDSRVVLKRFLAKLNLRSAQPKYLIEPITAPFMKKYVLSNLEFPTKDSELADALIELNTRIDSLLKS